MKRAITIFYAQCACNIGEPGINPCSEETVDSWYNYIVDIKPLCSVQIRNGRSSCLKESGVIGVRLKLVTKLPFNISDVVVVKNSREIISGKLYIILRVGII